MHFRFNDFQTQIPNFKRESKDIEIENELIGQFLYFTFSAFYLCHKKLKKVHVEH